MSNRFKPRACASGQSCSADPPAFAPRIAPDRLAGTASRAPSRPARACLLTGASGPRALSFPAAAAGSETSRPESWPSSRLHPGWCINDLTTVRAGCTTSRMASPKRPADQRESFDPTAVHQRRGRDPGTGSLTAYLEGPFSVSLSTSSEVDRRASPLFGPSHPRHTRRLSCPGRMPFTSSAPVPSASWSSTRCSSAPSSSSPPTPSWARSS